MKWYCFLFSFAVYVMWSVGAEQQLGTSASTENLKGSTGKIIAEGSANTRKLYPAARSPGNKQCVCGQTSPDTVSWAVDVRFNSTEFMPLTCYGIMIAHNLVVTSAKCLQRANPNRMDTYNDWQIFLTVTIAMYDGEYFLKVKNITNNIGTKTTSGLQFSAQDIAIIVVEGNLFQADLESDETFQEDILSPVCVPKNDKNLDVLMKDIVHRFGYYDGIQIAFPEHRSTIYRKVFEVLILEGDYCDKEGNFGNFSDVGALCTRTSFRLPTTEGGPLLTTNIGGYFNFSPEISQTAFLVGICSVTEKRPLEKSIAYTYFANVIQNLDFIEQVANEHDSMWCETPDLPDTEKASPDEIKLEEWSWETEPIDERSESLDCECGMVPILVQPEQENIAWAVKIHFLGSSNKPDEVSDCVGSIINDRVIVAAASCVFDFVNIKNISQEELKNISIIIGSRNFSNDASSKPGTIKKIIFHPGFLPYRQAGAYDQNYQLALLVLEEPLVFAARLPADVNDIRPICLPKVDEKIDINKKISLMTLQRHETEERKAQRVLRRITNCSDKLSDSDWENKFCREAWPRKIDTMLIGAPNAFQKNYRVNKFYQVGMDIKENWIYINGKNVTSKVTCLDLQKFVPFIEYHSNVFKAKWCKEKSSTELLEIPLPPEYEF